MDKITCPKDIAEIRNLLYKREITEDQALELMRQLRDKEKKPTS